ncbi:MAG TPA: hypothetical protein VFU65_11445 [Actinocrinis sp.]|nr:hypothetical protein [Actinocrinis sp.]
MVISDSASGFGPRLRRHSGVVAAMVAVVGFIFGAFGAYYVVDKPRPIPILLRQATEPEQMSSYGAVPGSGGVLVLLRNDGPVAVTVIDAAFARTSAAPPLYLASELVPPGGAVNVYVAVPAKCFSSNSFVAFDGVPPPVRILVSAREFDGPIQAVPVEITGTLATIMAQCGQAGQGN